MSNEHAELRRDLAIALKVNDWIKPPKTWPRDRTDDWYAIVAEKLTENLLRGWNVERKPPLAPH